MKYLLFTLLLGCATPPEGTLLGACHSDGTCAGALKCQYTEFALPHGAPYRCRPVPLPVGATE